MVNAKAFTVMPIPNRETATPIQRARTKMTLDLDEYRGSPRSLQHMHRRQQRQQATKQHVKCKRTQRPPKHSGARYGKNNPK
mmetsp:Transcript_176703/g.566653  ORF Transcript_176703/g.566653 Transcript_176703/m.566653 type:complete len:82 (+) Transcript_176703:2152-2397(+)